MPAGRTYTPISIQTLSTASGTITFSSIPNTYTDLILIWSGTTTTGVEARLRFNGDTGTNYSYTNLAGDGGGTPGIASRGSNQNLMFITTYGTPSTTQCNFILQIPNYSNTNTNKTVLVRGNRITSGFGPDLTAGLWRSNSAINQIDLIAGSTTWAVGSTFTLYGIAAA